MKKLQKQIRNELNGMILDSCIKVAEMKLDTTPENLRESFLKSIIRLKNFRDNK